jgi:hypothetical protein
VNIDTTHERNAIAGGWDVSIVATTDKGESIAAMRVEINGDSVWNQEIDPPVHKWQNQLTAIGQYPEHNRLIVTATAPDGTPYIAEDNW